MTDTPPTADATGIRALRIRFVSHLPDGTRPMESFIHPHRCFALAEVANPSDVVGSPPGGGPLVDLSVLLLPAGSATPFEWQRRAEEWMQPGPAPGSPPTIDLLVRSERALWRPGQAAIFGAPDRCDELLPGLVQFAFYEHELRKLEQGLDAEWDTVEADIPLTHSVGRPALERREHVDAMTRRTSVRRMQLVRLESCLEKPSPALASPARRLAGELAVQAEVLERLHWADDKLEVYEDLYELANDRLSEFTYFLREYRLEAWIIVLLLAEVVLMSVDIWLTLRSR